MLNTPLVVFTKSWMQNRTTKTAFGKFKASIISLLIGSLVAILVMYALNADGFAAFTDIFTNAFNPQFGLQATLCVAAVITVAALANAVAFRTGLFNIGVSGQMFFAAAISIILGLTTFKSMGIAAVAILMPLSMIIGGIVSGFAGFLKARFNVHEVVTTILLNWTLLYLVHWIVKKIPSIIESNSTKPFTGDLSLTSNPSVGWIFIAIASVLALGLTFMFWKTTFGFKIKATGLSADAVEYAGISKRRQIIFAMTISGLASGVAGWMIIFGQNYQINVTDTTLLSYGFDGLAVSLVAANNFIGIIPVSIFFGALQEGGASVLSLYGLRSEVVDLTIGIIMYLAAISSIFVRFRIIRYSFALYRFLWSSEHVALRRSYRQEMIETKNNLRNFLNSSQPQMEQMRQEIAKVKKHKRTLTNEEQLAARHKIVSIKKDLQTLIHDNEFAAHSKTLRNNYRHDQQLLMSVYLERFDARHSRYSRLVNGEHFDKIIDDYQTTDKAISKRRRDVWKTLVKGVRCNKKTDTDLAIDSGQKASLFTKLQAYFSARQQARADRRQAKKVFSQKVEEAIKQEVE